tara:strand:- start:39553 stop:40053 length:501 start_codon:yes stop_codon:yes gene_type:complete
MKRAFLTTVIVSALLVSCNDTKHKHENTETEGGLEVVEQHESNEIASENHSTNNLWVNEINLDNGNKWQANPETTVGVNNMLKLLKSGDLKTVADYHNLASQLNEEKNFVIKECTMKGASHDNLHIFLLPLIEKIDALGKVSTTTEGSEITASIEENLNGYYNYFK